MSNRPELTPPPEHVAMARALVAEMERHDGLAPVDVERFWADQEAANRDAFAAAQAPLGVLMSGECVWAELGVPEDFRGYETDPALRVRLNRAYNDRAERIVGRRLLAETPPDPAAMYPPTKALHDFFEARNEWHGWSWWLQPSAHSAAELAKLLDRVEQRIETPAAARAFMLPPGWDAEKARLQARGIRPPLYRWQRGPCTFATSIFGVENLLLLVLDEPALATRLRDVILRTMLTMARVLDEEAGYTPETAPRGFGFADDNCCLFTPDMYELFGLPVLAGVWQVYAPGAGDWRYQHSDSPMAHLLPLLGRLDLRGTNFGPTVTVAEIRTHLPRAVIDGQLAPFTLSNNEHERMVLELLRDVDQARPARGLRFATAGSINNGSSLQSMRLLMAAIQRYGRY